MTDNTTVLVVGTGTIGEPLIGLFSHLKDELGIKNVLFHKRTPLEHETAKVKSLVEKGASLVVDHDRIEEFRSLGQIPSYTTSTALEMSQVVVDCTPAGNANKTLLYESHASQTETVFVAQGSEKGFGMPYAWGVNDDALATKRQQFIQVVSCNTHSISRIISAVTQGSLSAMQSGDFVCIRRANDASQDTGFIPAPSCGKHSDDQFGTHHARDVNDLFQTIGAPELSIFSSALKVNSQYMHMIRFSILLGGSFSREDLVKRLSSDDFITTTKHSSTNRVFSFGRDHGFYGRIYNQAVVNLPTLDVSEVNGSTRITGFAMTPQDGNSLLSSIAATMYGMFGNDYLEKLDPIKKFLLNEV